jgi:hypothetical protein
MQRCNPLAMTASIAACGHTVAARCLFVDPRGMAFARMLNAVFAGIDWRRTKNLTDWISWERCKASTPLRKFRQPPYAAGRCYHTVIRSIVINKLMLARILECGHVSESDKRFQHGMGQPTI